MKNISHSESEDIPTAGGARSESPAGMTAALRAALDAEPSVALVLDREGTIRFLNRAWRDSLTAEQAKSCQPDIVLGRRYLDFVEGELKAHLERAMATARSLGPENGSVFLHGECNTPELCRKLTTRITALCSAQDPTHVGFLVHNEIRVAGPLRERYALVERPVEAWRNRDGLIVQCGCCRRVREPESSRWYMAVALLTETHDLTSHGLCELCLETYYAAPTAQ